MADVAVEVITPTTNFSEAGKAVYAREHSRYPEPTVRAVPAVSSNKEASHREPVVTKPPTPRRAWGRLTSPNDEVSTEGGGVGSQQRRVEGEALNGRDASTIQIPKDTKVCMHHAYSTCVCV